MAVGAVLIVAGVDELVVLGDGDAVWDVVDAFPGLHTFDCCQSFLMTARALLSLP